LPASRLMQALGRCILSALPMVWQQQVAAGPRVPGTVQGSTHALGLVAWALVLQAARLRRVPCSSWEQGVLQHMPAFCKLGMSR
jgi:hypothetical protein